MGRGEGGDRNSGIARRRGMKYLFGGIGQPIHTVKSKDRLVDTVIEGFGSRLKLLSSAIESCGLPERRLGVHDVVDGLNDPLGEFLVVGGGEEFDRRAGSLLNRKDEELLVYLARPEFAYIAWDLPHASSYTGVSMFSSIQRMTGTHTPSPKPNSD